MLKYLQDLTKEDLKTIQQDLKTLGYPVGEIDGLIGPKTRSAWAEFVEDHDIYDFQVVTDNMISRLAKCADLIIPEKKKELTQEEVIKDILFMCNKIGLPLITQKAYILATVDHETNHTFKPVVEAYWMSEEWRMKNLYYAPFYG